MLIWDDHEVENDHAGLQSERLSIDFAQQRAAAYQAYWEHMPFPKSARPQGAHMRIYGHLDWGRLARVLLLDDRQYRDPQVCPRPGRGGSNTVALRDCAELLNPARTLLGPAQEQWLARTWSGSHTWNLLAQQTLMARLAGRNRQGDTTYWTDGWDGYAPARNRLLNSAVAQGVRGLVALGGDVHAHYVAQLKADYDDPHSPVVGAEFCGTSISSRGPAQSRLNAARADNPHLLYANGTQRGSVHFIMDAHSLQADLRAVDDVRDPGSAVRSVGRYVVQAGRPGVQAA
jgi:alkaline phosphatase D